LPAVELLAELVLDLQATGAIVSNSAVSRIVNPTRKYYFVKLGFYTM
jgi:hypothetical protein